MTAISGFDFLGEGCAGKIELAQLLLEDLMACLQLGYNTRVFDYD